jgi:hypothetical protein
LELPIHPYEPPSLVIIIVFKALAALILEIDQA